MFELELVLVSFRYVSSSSTQALCASSSSDAPHQPAPERPPARPHSSRNACRRCLPPPTMRRRCPRRATRATSDDGHADRSGAAATAHMRRRIIQISGERCVCVCALLCTICPIPKSLTARDVLEGHRINVTAFPLCIVGAPAAGCRRRGTDGSDARRCEPAEQVHDARVRMGERESHGLCVATRRATRSSSGRASRLLDICPTRQRARGRCGAALAAHC